MPTPLNRREALAGMLTSSAALLAASLTTDNPLFAKEPPPAQSTARPRITISKETTYITEPLRPDGLPDYVAALNQHCSRGVTPENNAAVLLLKAMGPKEIEPDRREKYFQMLGIAPLPEKGEYFRPSYDQAKLHRAIDGLVDKDGNLLQDPLYEQQTESMRRPWSRQEFPVWAEWIDINERPMMLLTEASKRPRCYLPWFYSKKGGQIDVGLLQIQKGREAVRAFVARAMLRLHESKIDEAWADLLACHRLARLIGQGPTLVESLVAITMDSIANAGDLALIEHAKLSAEKITTMRQELAALPPVSNPAECFDIGERFFFLNYLLKAACETPAERNKALLDIETGGFGESKSTVFQPIFAAMGDIEIDWNTVLHLANSWYDRSVDTLRITERAERRKAEAVNDKELQRLREAVNDVKSLQGLSRADLRKSGSKMIGQACNATQVFTSVFAAAMDHAAMNSELTQLAFALAAYRADHHAYPDKLDDAVPKYIPSVPKDIFNSDAPLHYARRNDGFELYSVGRNGRDDGGKGQDDDSKGDEGWDDLVVRVPFAKR